MERYDVPFETHKDPPSINYTCLNKHRRVLWKTEIFEGPAEKRDSQYQASDVDLE